LFPPKTGLLEFVNPNFEHLDAMGFKRTNIATDRKNRGQAVGRHCVIDLKALSCKQIAAAISFACNTGGFSNWVNVSVALLSAAATIRIFRPQKLDLLQLRALVGNEQLAIDIMVAMGPLNLFVLCIRPSDKPT
jgi:hypothetical protein